MREVKAEQIIKSKYSLENGQVVEDEKGEFYSKQIANQVLNYQTSNNLESIKKLKELDKTQKYATVEKVCLERYIALKSQEDSSFEFDNRPIKKYEIYKLCIDTEKLMMCDTKYFSDSEEKEVYYDKDIAFEIYEIMSQLEENVANSFPELLELYQEEIIEKQREIEDLQKEDEAKFQEAINTYELINASDIFQKMKNDYEFSQKENFELKEQLEKSSQMIRDLSKKLQVSLKKYEELKNSKLSFWERIMGFFNRQKRLTDGKN